MEKVFTDIYEKNVWGNNNCIEYTGSSGNGSSIDYNKNKYVPFLRKFIIENDIKTIVDLGCGDFRCGKMIYEDLNVSYVGYDAYKKLIDYNSKEYPNFSFIHLDFCNNKEKIINSNMCILKDVLQHWTLKNIYEFLDYLVKNKVFKYIFICNCCNQKIDNTDIQNGDWRPLSCDYLPLNRYNIRKLFNYNTKEISVIEV